jgi:hypothetical protein
MCLQLVFSATVTVAVVQMLSFFLSFFLSPTCTQALGDSADGWRVLADRAIGCADVKQCLLPDAPSTRNCTIVAAGAGGPNQCTWPDLATGTWRRAIVPSLRAACCLLLCRTLCCAGANHSLSRCDLGTHTSSRVAPLHQAGRCLRPPVFRTEAVSFVSLSLSICPVTIPLRLRMHELDPDRPLYLERRRPPLAPGHVALAHHLVDESPC